MEYAGQLAQRRPDTRRGGRIRGDGHGFAAGTRPSAERPLQTASGFQHREQTAVFGGQPQCNAVAGTVRTRRNLGRTDSDACFVDVCGGCGGCRSDKRTDYVSVGQYFAVGDKAVLGRRLYRSQRFARARRRHQPPQYPDDAGRPESPGRAAFGQDTVVPQQPPSEPFCPARQYFGRLCYPYGRNSRTHPFGFG